MSPNVIFMGVKVDHAILNSGTSSSLSKGVK